MLIFVTSVNKDPLTPGEIEIEIDLQGGMAGLVPDSNQSENTADKFQVKN